MKATVVTPQSCHDLSLTISLSELALLWGAGTLLSGTTCSLFLIPLSRSQDSWALCKQWVMGTTFCSSTTNEVIFFPQHFSYKQLSILKLHFCHKTLEERVQIWYTDIFLSSERLICAAPAWLTPALGHLRKAQPAPAKRKNCWFLSNPAAIPVPGETEVIQPCPWHLGDAALEQLQDCLPRAATAGVGREPSVGTCPWEWAHMPQEWAHIPVVGMKQPPHTVQGFSVYYVAGFQGGITAQSLKAF